VKKNLRNLYEEIPESSAKKFTINIYG